MRKLLFCVPMMILLLSACTGGAEGNEAEELALQIRGEYLAMSSCAGQAAITADYGQRVYQYELAVAVDGEETTLTLSAPDTVAGITARVTGQDGQLEYDGLSVETGPLDPEGLSPVSAVPALLEGARSGYIVSCALEEDGAPAPYGLWGPGGNSGHRKRGIPVVDTSTHALSRGEISVDGFRAILCEFTDFAMS